MTELRPIDAVLLMSFGGPEQPDEVLPFLQNVTRGRGIPDERLVEVGEHYYGFGGKSPINDQNKDLLKLLEAELASREIDVPIYWGNRNWTPYLIDKLREMHAAGHRRILGLTTSAYSSYSSCRQYREDFGMALETLAAEGIDLEIDKIRQYYNHPGFADAQVDSVTRALDELGADDRARLVFVTHSIPDPMQAASARTTPGYLAQHEALAQLVAEQVAERTGVERRWDLVFCSRSGAPGSPWLEPDINDHLEELADAGETSGVVVVPIGFISDHMEVKFDLDTEAKATAAGLGLPFVRAASVSTHPAFISGLCDLVEERAAQLRGETPAMPSVTPLRAEGPGSGACSAGCCLGRVLKPVRPQWAES
ncbi:ferrochelatase [Saxibacter everestensis]|uniref:Coproporphyrin III ferrochelatase n=1 Tax=Saxibacter everestensis TaxID=2909229 RepID=A0ABY8QYL0_9MICO|nr:ferrochelatase [Brevibacteriaceae bacterium ZFBP1038]